MRARAAKRTGCRMDAARRPVLHAGFALLLTGCAVATSPSTATAPATPTAPAAAQPASAGTPARVREVLPNGLRLIIQDHRAANIVAVYLYIGVGVRCERLFSSSTTSGHSSGRM